MASACSDHTSPYSNQQENVALVEITPGGDLVINRAMVQSFAPNLLQQVLAGAGTPTYTYEQKGSTLRNVETFPGTPREHKTASPKPKKDIHDHYEKARIANFQQGRIWSSQIRRLVREQKITRYEAMQAIAQYSGRPVTDIRCLVELHNKAAKEKCRNMRQNLVWLKHLQGMNDKQIAAALNIHSKTVASDRREMKQRQLGGTENVHA